MGRRVALVLLVVPEKYYHWHCGSNLREGIPWKVAWWIQRTRTTKTRATGEKGRDVGVVEVGRGVVHAGGGEERYSSENVVVVGVDSVVRPAVTYHRPVGAKNTETMHCCAPRPPRPVVLLAGAVAFDDVPVLFVLFFFFWLWPVDLFLLLLPLPFVLCRYRRPEGHWPNPSLNLNFFPTIEETNVGLAAYAFVGVLVLVW